MGDVTGTVVTGIGRNPWQRMAFHDAYFQHLEPPGEGERFIQSDDDILVTMRLRYHDVVDVYSSTPARRTPARIFVVPTFGVCPLYFGNGNMHISRGTTVQERSGGQFRTRCDLPMGITHLNRHPSDAQWLHKSSQKLHRLVLEALDVVPNSSIPPCKRGWSLFLKE